MESHLYVLKEMGNAPMHSCGFAMLDGLSYRLDGLNPGLISAVLPKASGGQVTVGQGYQYRYRPTCRPAANAHLKMRLIEPSPKNSSPAVKSCTR